MSGNGLECLECNLQFASKEELVNHKEKFCVESDWFDPVVMKQTLEAEHAMEVKDRKALTLGEVKDYLKKRTSAANDPHIAGMTLKDMRGEFQKGDKSLEELHQRITRQRHEEKAEELRQLQLRQQQARAEKNKEERELRDLMLNLEKQKESELRKRMEREMIKRELRNLDAVQLKSIEMDRKEEIANLARQRELVLECSSSETHRKKRTEKPRKLHRKRARCKKRGRPPCFLLCLTLFRQLIQHIGQTW